MLKLIEKGISLKQLAFMMCVLVSGAFFTSCGGDDDEPTPDDDSESIDVAKSGQMVALIDGNKFSTETVSATINGDIVAIIGLVSSTNEKISIGLNEFSSTGTYVLSPSGVVNALGYNINTEDSGFDYTSNGNKSDNDEDGQVVITKYDKENNLISGTFFAEVVQGETLLRKKIESGSFTDIPIVDLNDPNTGGGNTTKSSSASATIDGDSWVGTSVNAFSGFGNLSISGFSTGNNKDISLVFPVDATPGTYTFSQFGTYRGSIIEGTKLYSSGSGTLTITSNDVSKKTVKGSFEFEAQDFLDTDSVSVTNGVFSVEY